jgi:O-antigen/teichoic acid export membrane protein
MGYNIYVIFLMVSTAGLPSAVAKEIARYDALDDEATGYRLTRVMIGVMTGIGVLFAIAMYLFAPLVAHASGGGAALTSVIRSLSWAMLLFPVMSIIRGFFQGKNDLKVFAVSEFFEQVVRVIWMLATTFAIMKMGDGDYQNAVTQSTFAAFVGMLAAFGYLVYYLHKTGNLSKLLYNTPAKHDIHPMKLLKDTLIQAVPFVILSSSVQIFKLIDQMTFVNTMKAMSDYKDSYLLELFSYFTANPDKLTMVLISFATSLNRASISLLTAEYTKGNRKSVKKLILDNLALFITILTPMIAVLIVLHKPVYVAFYGNSPKIAYSLFIFALVQAYVIGMYTLLPPLMQSLQHNRQALRIFMISLIVKVIVQFPSIWLFKAYGPLTANMIALTVGTVLYLKAIYDISQFKIKPVVGTLLFSVVGTVASIIVSGLVYKVIGGASFGQAKALLITVLAGGLGAGVYLVFIAKAGLLEFVLGDSGTRLRRKLRV